MLSPVDGGISLSPVRYFKVVFPISLAQHHSSGYHRRLTWGGSQKKMNCCCRAPASSGPSKREEVSLNSYVDSNESYGCRLHVKKMPAKPTPYPTPAQPIHPTTKIILNHGEKRTCEGRQQGPHHRAEGTRPEAVPLEGSEFNLSWNGDGVTNADGLTRGFIRAVFDGHLCAELEGRCSLETNVCASERGIKAESPTRFANIPAWLLRLDPMMPANESGLLWNSHVDVVPIQSCYTSSTNSLLTRTSSLPPHHPCPIPADENRKSASAPPSAARSPARSQDSPPTKDGSLT